MFQDYYRHMFPDATIHPKVCIMEDHVIPWLERWHIGAGLMVDQGAELIRMLESEPSVVALRPPPQKRYKT